MDQMKSSAHVRVYLFNTVMLLYVQCQSNSAIRAKFDMEQKMAAGQTLWPLN